MTALTTALAACGGSDSSSSDPQQVIDNATMQGIESGNLDLSLKVNAEGKEGGNVDVSLSGPFQSEGAGKIPKLDLTLGVNGSMGEETIDFEGGLVLLPDRAFINYKGDEYEVDPTNFSFVKSAIEQAQQAGGEEGESADTTACQEAAGELEIGDFLDNLTNEGSAEVDGTTTTHISGDLNVDGAIDSLSKLSEDPACSSPLAAAGSLPSGSQLEEAKSQISDALKSAHVDVYGGEDDIVREISAELSIEPPAGSGEGPEKADVSFDLKIGGVNEEQKIETPSSTKPLSNLFMELGVNPLELLQQGGSGGLGDLEGLLNGLGESSGGGSGGGGAAGSVPGLPSADPQAQQEYLKCLGKATTPTDLQHCAELVK
ncbi:MAG TPA: hypothetical protein VG518_00725 [Solirubrobacterales bacterium]|nr:hypothetical protein [Solirubrobacterales bacterium]